MIMIIDYFKKAYSGGLLKQGKMAVHEAKEVYIALSDKVTAKVLSSISDVETIENAFIDGKVNIGGNRKISDIGRSLAVKESISSTYTPSNSIGSVMSVYNSSIESDVYAGIVFGSNDDSNVGRHGAWIGMKKNGNWAQGVNYGGTLSFWARPDSLNNQIEVMTLSTEKASINTSLDIKGMWDNPMILNSNGYIWNDGTNIRGKVGSIPTSAADGSILI